MEIEFLFFSVGQDLADRSILFEIDGFFNKAVEVVFHFRDLGGLVLGVEILMNNTDAAELGHLYSHFSFGHGIHGRAGNWDPEPDVAGKFRFNHNVVRQSFGISGRQPHVIIGKGNALVTDLLEKCITFRDQFFCDTLRKSTFYL